jgi:hypothetical protein
VGSGGSGVEVAVGSTGGEVGVGDSSDGTVGGVVGVDSAVAGAGGEVGDGSQGEVAVATGVISPTGVAVVPRGSEDPHPLATAVAVGSRAGFGPRSSAF